MSPGYFYISRNMDIIRTILDDPRNTNHELPRDLVYESLRDVQTYRYCKLHGVCTRRTFGWEVLLTYHGFSFERLSFIPPLEVIHDLSESKNFMTQLYFVSYVFSLGPRGQEARDVFEWIEEDEHRMSLVDGWEFIRKHPSATDRGGRGETLAMCWVACVNTDPPEWIGHDPTLKDNNGNTLAAIWAMHADITEVVTTPREGVTVGPERDTSRTLSKSDALRMPEWMRHDPALKSRYGRTLAMCRIKTDNNSSDDEAKGNIVFKNSVTKGI